MFIYDRNCKIKRISLLIIEKRGKEQEPKSPNVIICNPISFPSPLEMWYVSLNMHFSKFKTYICVNSEKIGAECQIFEMHMVLDDNTISSRGFGSGLDITAFCLLLPASIIILFSCFFFLQV